MKNRMLRSFLPVGHGAFYCEQFKIDGYDEKINIVYDCGAKKKTLVQQYIKQNFDQGETIHALFISHLHDDHINGVPELLKYCNVKKIFFPLLSDEMKLVTAIYNAAGEDKNNFSASFAWNPEETLERLVLHDKPILYRIEVGSMEGEEGLGNIVEPQEDEKYGRNISSGCDVVELVRHSLSSTGTQSMDWVFIPYNYECEDRKNLLLSELAMQFKKTMTVEELEDIWKRGNKAEFDKIKKAYEKVAPSHNPYTMTLYSGPQNDASIRIVHPRYIEWKYRCIFEYGWDWIPGCLYTGDYDAKDKKMWNGLRQGYKKYWSSISCVQIPHHGSKDNYNPKFADMDAFFVISAKEGDAKHPAPSVVKDLRMSGYDPFVVTEKSESALHFIIQF